MEQIDLLRYLVEVMERLGIPYMVVGSLASGAYGEPRMTRDIDVVVDITEAQVPVLCGAFPPEEFYVSEEAALDAVRSKGQFNVIHPASGNKIDLMVAKGDAWGRSQISRRQRVLILPDLEGYCARPEDVILSKMRYYREGGSEKHLRDIAGMLKVSGDEIDRDYVLRWAEKMGIADIWRTILEKLAKPPQGENGRP